MSLSSATGGGGSVAPGWYTDPHDPRQLRWWSGEGWTEHVSPGAGQTEVAQASAAQAAPAQAAPVQAAPVQAAAVPAQAAPLPSRRALRDPAAEASEATAAAESALAAQAAQQQAQFAEQQQAAAQAQQLQAAYGAQPAAPAQPQYAVPSAPQPSAPVPTLPVAPTSFLEQQGYAPLGGGPVAPAQPQAFQPAQPAQPVQPVQPAQPVQPNAWNQPVQPVQPVQPAQPNAWNQPVQPEQQGWGSAPAASDGIDSLFGAAAGDQSTATAQQGNQWGLTPTDAGGRSRTRDEGVSGSSTFWAWLIAISPILAAGSVGYVLLTTKSALTDWPFEAAVAAPFLLVLLFALGDRAVLSQLGHSRPASPGWALLSAPIYLVARSRETRREDGSGTAVVLVWFVSVLVAAAGIVGYGLLTHQALFPGLPT